MKKLLMTSAVLLFFSASIFMFQLSCSKDATARSSGSFSQGKILTYAGGSRFIVIDKNGLKEDVNITLPNGFNVITNDGFTTDGNYIWFRAGKQLGTTPPFSYSWELMICDMNGNNVKSVFKYDVSTIGNEIHAF